MQAYVLAYIQFIFFIVNKILRYQFQAQLQDSDINIRVI